MEKVIRMADPNVSDFELEFVTETVKDGWVSSHGRFVNLFEKEFAIWQEAKFACAVSSGTAALHLALLACGIGRDDEVLIPSTCMAAPAFAIRYCEAIPVPVDIGDDWNIDIGVASGHLSSRTKAVLVVHNYGWPSNMSQIEKFADANNLLVVEDVAEAIGGKWKGKKLGNFGDVSCFSLYANKVITSGEGGVVVSDKAHVVDEIRSLKNMCFGTGASRFEHSRVGYNYRISNLQAAFAYGQLKRIDYFLDKRSVVAREYEKFFDSIVDIGYRVQPKDGVCSHWVFGIVFQNKVDVEAIQARLTEKGIESRRVFPPLQQQPFLQDINMNSSCSRAKELWDRGLLLPITSQLQKSDVKRVCESLMASIE